MISEDAGRARSSPRTATSTRPADALIDEANEAGGRDNITVVLFRFEEVADGEGAEQATMVGLAARPPPRRPRPATRMRGGDPDRWQAADPRSHRGRSRRPRRGRRAPASARSRARRARAASQRAAGRPGPPRHRFGKPISRADRDRDRRCSCSAAAATSPAASCTSSAPTRRGSSRSTAGFPYDAAVRGPAVRDVLRLGRPGLADPGGPARDAAQPRPALADDATTSKADQDDLGARTTVSG